MRSAGTETLLPPARKIGAELLSSRADALNREHFTTFHGGHRAKPREKDGRRTDDERYGQAVTLTDSLWENFFGKKRASSSICIKWTMMSSLVTFRPVGYVSNALRILSSPRSR